MMYTKENIQELKGALKTGVQGWVEEKIDALFGRGHVVGHYMKRGLANYMAQMDEDINRGIDVLAMFAMDEAGRLDVDAVIDDAVQLFREMEVRETRIGMLNVRYGAGRIVVDVPHSLMYDMIFGKYGSITISTEDILEIKNLLK
jgi:predicted GNAT superfamily acetyltransferase